MMKLDAFVCMSLRLGILLLCSMSWAAPALVPPPPQIAAHAFILMDYHTGKVLAAHEPDTQVEPASLTKMMTMYVIDYEQGQGRLKMDERVHVSDKAWKAQGSRMFLEANARVPVQDLIKGVIIQSGNDASIALAEHIAGSEAAFVDLMNQHAQRLGMHHTHFMNVTGMPEADHYTTARDMARLATALIRDFPDSYALYREKWFTYNGIKQPNRNRLLWRNEWVDGIKTGSTEQAGFCLVASAQKESMRLISVVMGTSSDEARTEESQKLLSYGFRFYETHKLFDHHTPLRTTRIWMGNQKELSLGPGQDVYVTIPQGSYAQLEAHMQLNQPIKAPVLSQAPVGRLVLRLQEEVVQEIPLIALDQVETGGLWTRFSDYVSMSIQQMRGTDTTT